MHKLPLILLPLACALALSGCGSNGKAVKPTVCPTLPPPPANLMASPDYEQTVRAELLQPQPDATHKSPDYRR